MKILGLVMVLANLSSMAFAATSVEGKAQVVKSADPYTALSATVVQSSIHEAKVAALLNAMNQCKSEAVSRTGAWQVNQDVKHPNCVQYYDGCLMDGSIVVTVTAQANFSCLPGPTPDLN